VDRLAPNCSRSCARLPPSRPWRLLGRRRRRSPAQPQERPGVDLVLPCPAGRTTVYSSFYHREVVAPALRTEDVMTSGSENGIEVRPFQVGIPEEELAELR